MAASASTNWSFSSEVDEDRRGNAREWYERDGDAAGPGPGALTLKRPARTIMAHGGGGWLLGLSLRHVPPVICPDSSGPNPKDTRRYFHKLAARSDTRAAARRFLHYLFRNSKKALKSSPRNLIRCRAVRAAPKKQNFEVTEVTSISDRRRAPDAGVQAKSKRTNAALKASPRRAPAPLPALETSARAAGQPTLNASEVEGFGF